VKTFGRKRIPKFYNGYSLTPFARLNSYLLSLLSLPSPSPSSTVHGSQPDFLSQYAEVCGASQGV